MATVAGAAKGRISSASCRPADWSGAARETAQPTHTCEAKMGSNRANISVLLWKPNWGRANFVLSFHGGPKCVCLGGFMMGPKSGPANKQGAQMSQKCRPLSLPGGCTSCLGIGCEITGEGVQGGGG